MLSPLFILLLYVSNTFSGVISEGYRSIFSIYTNLFGISNNIIYTTQTLCCYETPSLSHLWGHYSHLTSWYMHALVGLHIDSCNCFFFFYCENNSCKECALIPFLLFTHIIMFTSSLSYYNG